MPIPVQKENKQDQAHIFQGTFFESFQVHQIFERTNRDILPNLLLSLP